MKLKIFKFLIAGLAILIFSVWTFGFSEPKVLGDFQFSGQSSNSSENLKVVFLNVGQGDAILIIFPNGEQALIDGGPDKSAMQKISDYLPPFDKKIEYVVLTHPHSDHLAGFIEIFDRYEIGQIFMTGVTHTTDDYLEFLRLIEEKNIKTIIIDSIKTLDIASTTWQFLAPAESLAGRRIDNLNNSSIVFKLSYVSTSVLFMGDYENEEELASSSPEVLKSDILKVGHHGSTNANDKDFLAAVSPDYAIIQAGKDNKFGHPHYRVVYYLKQLGARIFRTDEQDDIVLSSDGSNINLK